jgi:hypothetical protein
VRGAEILLYLSSLDVNFCNSASLVLNFNKNSDPSGINGESTISAKEAREGRKRC